MKKKIILLAFLILFATGCSIKKVDVNNYDTLIDNYFNEKRNVPHESFSGYSLYIPKGLKTVSKDDNNLVFMDKYNNRYYVFVDTVSYYNKSKINAKKYKDDYYFKKIKGKNSNGYIEVLDKSKKYFVRSNYNYVKIEVYSSKKSLSDTIINVCEIMSSIKYNDKILKLSFDNNSLNYKEEDFNIFTSKHKNNTNYLEYVYDNDDNISSVESNGKDEDMIDVDIDE